MRLNLLFALAHVADARGEYAEAAACLEPANGMSRELRQGRGQTYDPDQHTRHVDRLIAAFTPEALRRLHGLSDNSARPIFVFGMPRSGTTLTEQVLASHSQVFGAGELPLAHQAMDAVPAVAGRPEDMSAAVEALEGLRQLAANYQDGVRTILDRAAGGKDPVRVVDKMPDNYLWLGLVALMFPRATLIHVRRDVRDVAVSCWMTQFRSIRWADDLDSLARRILDHRRLMAHWQAVLPVPVHEVCYERLVDDFEAEARRLVAACGRSGSRPVCASTKPRAPYGPRASPRCASRCTARPSPAGRRMSLTSPACSIA